MSGVHLSCCFSRLCPLTVLSFLLPTCSQSHDAPGRVSCAQHLNHTVSRATKPTMTNNYTHSTNCMTGFEMRKGYQEAPECSRIVAKLQLLLPE
ncbi:hypothetical protein EV356DRAFT_328234 [Viridothelium virens]|uniref:Secreted protein n=1 Tax=Viridothelium virens TaxID=1048519 RepID=A0A6A6GYE8_VIRVR|nr:hypothetical protein EV356DRAFT_328234 [Viridothelium virens]